MKKKVATPYHPRQCHLCKYDGVNALLRKRGLPICKEAERACLRCKDPGLPNDGVSWVHMDAAANPSTVYDKRTAPDYLPNAPDEHKCVVEGPAREGILDLLRRFGGIPFDSAGVVCGMLAGKTLVEMAAEQKMSVQVLHAKWKRACAADPIWKAIENGMMGKGVGRKKKTFEQEAREQPTQMEMEM